MTKNVRLNWIAEAEARRFEESVMIQHGLSEPTAGVILAEARTRQRHWVRRLVARLAAGPRPARPSAVRLWPDKRPR
ncbi:MAG: hypothetical protein WAV02_12700 [Stellaceae bacterium]